MLIDYLLALLLPPLLMLGWVAVQNAWRRRFPSPDEDGDVLAGRGGCGPCGCTTLCGSDADTPKKRRP